MKKIAFFAGLLFFVFWSQADAQSVTGLWKTIDDETEEAKSYVKIYKQKGKLYGKITKLLQEDPNQTCSECPDEGKFDSKGERMIGLHIIKGLEKDDDEWEGDDGIMDPENGKVYDCKVWVDEDEPGKLNVRGYFGFFYRTQNWYRVE